MKRRETKELHSRTLTDLRKLLLETRKNLLKLVVETRGRKVKDYHSVSKAKDDIARIATVINEKEVQEAK